MIDSLITFLPKANNTMPWQKYNLNYNKIASAMIVDEDFLSEVEEIIFFNTPTSEL